MSRLPLEGVRVADLTVVLAGPGATMLLADWGAEVIRIEPLQVFQPTTRGRSARPSQALLDANRLWIFAYPGWKAGGRLWNLWPFFQAHARNKLSMTADIQTPEGRQALLDLVRVSDIVIENNVPETATKLGFEYEQLRRIKPDLIMLRMPAYGLTGPYSNYRSLGSHLEGTAGHTLIRGYEDTDPSLTEDVFFGDANAAVHAAFAAAAAIYQLRRTGKGQVIELAQTESLIPLFGEMLLDYQMNGRIARARGNDHYTMAPHGAYPCAGDDRWVAIAVGNDREWQELLRAMGSPAWAADQRFATQPSRYQHRRELDRLVSEWTRGRDDRWVMETLQHHGVPAGILNNEADAYTDRQLQDRGFFQEFTHPDAGTHRYPGQVWRMAGTPNRIRTPPVTLGEHNTYAYKELLGVTPADYARLKREGRIGTEYPPRVQ